METVAGWLRRGAAAMLQMGPVPRHVAFIMDGNRRFAERQQLETSRGHSRGYDKVGSALPPATAVRHETAWWSSLHVTAEATIPGPWQMAYIWQAAHAVHVAAASGQSIQPSPPCSHPHT